MIPLRVFIGWDPREIDAYRVAERSLRRHSSVPLEIYPLILEQLRDRGLYKRPTDRRDGRLWDEISGAPMATEFALSRFLVPALADYKGWALFCDCDFMFRADVAKVFALADEKYAAMCVQHLHAPTESTKMDGQVQTSYWMKNWSSFVLWNCGHLHHAGQVDRVNRWPGLWLHQFKWLPRELIGAIPIEWNWLEGTSSVAVDPAAVHYTRGVPSMAGYAQSAYADEWRVHARG